MMKARNAILEALRYRLGDTLVPDYYETQEELEEVLDLHEQDVLKRGLHLDQLEYEAENDFIYDDRDGYV